MSRGDASSLAKEWDSLNGEEVLNRMDAHSESLPVSPKNYRMMHFDILEFYEESRDTVQGGPKEKYNSDLDFGLKLYEYLNEKHGMDAVTASDDDVWRYMQMEVVPAIIFDRWPADDVRGNINDERFWKNSRRIWLKTLWWYVHLSLQNDSLTETRKILSENNSDTISQLVERSGVGYRIDLYREIMKRLYLSESSDRNLLRKVLKLNVVHCATIEPLLFASGLGEYVENLFAYFE